MPSENNCIMEDVDNEVNFLNPYDFNDSDSFDSSDDDENCFDTCENNAFVSLNDNDGFESFTFEKEETDGDLRDLLLSSEKEEEKESVNIEKENEEENFENEKVLFGEVHGKIIEEEKEKTRNESVREQVDEKKGSNRTVFFTPLLILGVLFRHEPDAANVDGCDRSLGYSGDGLTADLQSGSGEKRELCCLGHSNGYLSAFSRHQKPNTGDVILGCFSCKHITISCGLTIDCIVLIREELKQEVLSDVDDFRVDFGNSVSDKEDGEESAPELESKKLELKNKGSLSKSDSNGDDGERWGAVGPASHLTASPSRLLSWERDFSNGDQQLEWATRSLPSLRQLPPLSDGGSFGGDGSGEASPTMRNPHINTQQHYINPVRYGVSHGCTFEPHPTFEHQNPTAKHVHHSGDSGREHHGYNVVLCLKKRNETPQDCVRENAGYQKPSVLAGGIRNLRICAAKPEDPLEGNCWIDVHKIGSIAFSRSDTHLILTLTIRVKPVTEAKEVAMEAPERDSSPPRLPTNKSEMNCREVNRKLTEIKGPAKSISFFTSPETSSQHFLLSSFPDSGINNGISISAFLSILFCACQIRTSQGR
nr:hypothetical protein AXF42_Ash015272 [Ipomoea batatas]